MARTGTTDLTDQAETEENEVTRPSDLGFGQREIVVDSIQEQAAPPDESGFVVVRMAVTVEEFTYGNPHITYHLEAGKRYRMPVDIARYLWSLDKLYLQE